MNTNCCSTVVADRIIVVGGTISGQPTDIVEMFNTTTCSWNQSCSLLPFPMADFALAKVDVENLDAEVIEKNMKFKDDVVVANVKRVVKPITEHFS